MRPTNRRTSANQVSPAVIYSRAPGEPWVCAVRGSPRILCRLSLLFIRSPSHLFEKGAKNNWRKSRGSPLLQAGKRCFFASPFGLFLFRFAVFSLQCAVP